MDRRGDSLSGAGIQRARKKQIPIFVTSIYSAAWGLILLGSGRYWDDWAALDLSWQATLRWAHQIGHFWQMQFLYLLSALPATERIGHLLVFASYLVCAFIAHRLLAYAPRTTGVTRVIVPALFAVFPVNAARYALMNLIFAISLAIFMVGWWLIAVDLSRPRVVRRIAAAGLFLFALVSTGSFLMFVTVVPLYVAWVRFPQLRVASGRRTFLIRYGFLFMLPAVAWAVRAVALRPSGLYDGYNELGLRGALGAVSMLPSAFRESVLDPVLSAFASNILIVLLLAAALYVVLHRSLVLADSELAHSWWEHFAFVGAGVTVVILGVFPYLAVGKLPQSSDWASRHQLLVPFGAAILVYALVALAVRAFGLRSSSVLLVSCVLLGAFIVADVRTSLAYQVDWYKQVSLMQRMGESDAMRRGTHFIFSDETKDLNAAGRTYRPYEYTGMMRKVFGSATRFGVDELGAGAFDPMVLREHKQYNVWEYEPTTERVAVTIRLGSVDVRDVRVLLGLMWRETFQPRDFRRAVTDVVRIETRLASLAADGRSSRDRRLRERATLGTASRRHRSRWLHRQPPR